MLGSEELEYGGGRLEEQPGVDGVEWGVFELLADGGLGDADGLRDLPLVHALGLHGPKCECATKPRDIFGASC